MKVISLKALLALFLVVSCSKVPTINLKEHTFNKAPDDIVLVQISNLDQDVFAQLKFSQTLVESKIFTENFNCIGQMWRMNHTLLKPSIEDSLFTQISGFPRSEKSCEKYKTEKLLAENFLKFGYGAIYYEKGISSFIDGAKSCNEEIFKNSIVFRSTEASKVMNQSFHAEKRATYDLGKIYDDESCSKSGCFTSDKANFTHIWSSVKNFPRKIFVYRELAPEKMTIKDRAKRITQLDDLLIYLTGEFANKNPQALIIVTNTNENSISTKVWALGPMSENFCGEYNELSFYNRFFWKSQKTEIFPFKIP